MTFDSNWIDNLYDSLQQDKSDEKRQALAALQKAWKLLDTKQSTKADPAKAIENIATILRDGATIPSSAVTEVLAELQKRGLKTKKLPKRADQARKKAEDIITETIDDLKKDRKKKH